MPSHIRGGNGHWVWLIVAAQFFVAQSATAEPIRAIDTLLPTTTVGFVSATNYDHLAEQWSKTNLGKLMAEPAMSAFEQDMHKQIREHWMSVSGRLGLTLDDLKGVPAGETVLALLEPVPGEAASAMVLDVSGRRPQALAAIQKARSNLIAMGAKETASVVGNANVMVFQFPIAQGATAPEQTVYFLSPEFLGASDDKRVVDEVLGRLTKNVAEGSISKMAPYQMVMRRCADDAGGAVPQVRWFIAPIGYVEAMRAATPADKRRRGKTILEIMKQQGYGAIQGVGGYVDFSPKGYDILHRTAIYAPLPYTESMKMFSLPNHKDFTPQNWVPKDISTYTTLYVDILNSFDNFGPLYDQIVGEPGVWKQTLQGMKEDPNGPQIDLRRELVMNLGQRVTMISDFNTPITTSSERLLWAIEVKDPKAVALAIEKSVKNDPTVKKRVVDGHDVWEIVEEEDAAVPSISLDVPSLTPNKEAPKDAEDKDEEKEAHLLPHGAITVTNGELLVASHIDFLLKVLKPIPEASMLRNDLQFQQNWATVETKLGFDAQCARHFSWTDRELFPTYELIHQGKMPESQSLLGRALNTISGAGKKGSPRQQRISGSNLPDYNQFVRWALGTGAGALTSDGSGWFMKGYVSPHEEKPDVVKQPKVGEAQPAVTEAKPVAAEEKHVTAEKPVTSELKIELK